MFQRLSFPSSEKLWMGLWIMFCLNILLLRRILARTSHYMPPLCQMRYGKALILKGVLQPLLVKFGSLWLLR